MLYSISVDEFREKASNSTTDLDNVVYQMKEKLKTCKSEDTSFDHEVHSKNCNIF